MWGGHSIRMGYIRQNKKLNLYYCTCENTCECCWVVVCLQVHSCDQWNPIMWCLDGIKTSSHMALHVSKTRCLRVLMEEERVFILTHKIAVSFPTCSLAQPTSWVPHSLLHQSSLLTKTTKPTHSGAAHCGLYKLVSLATATPLLSETLLHSGRASAASEAGGPVTVSERPWQRPPELETDCLGARECSINLTQHATRRNDIKRRCKQVFKSTDQTAYCLVKWTCKSIKHQWMFCLGINQVENIVNFIKRMWCKVWYWIMCWIHPECMLPIIKSCSYWKTSGRGCYRIPANWTSDKANGIISLLMEGGINWINAQRPQTGVQQE